MSKSSEVSWEPVYCWLGSLGMQVFPHIRLHCHCIIRMSLFPYWNWLLEILCGRFKGKKPFFYFSIILLLTMYWLQDQRFIELRTSMLQALLIIKMVKDAWLYASLASHATPGLRDPPLRLDCLTGRKSHPKTLLLHNPICGYDYDS